MTGIRDDDFVHAVREDPTRKGLLYAGTQHGVYISYDDGDHWESLRLNLPDIPVWDLVVADANLAISTHGRGFYILDNIEPLRQYNAAALSSSDPILFKPAPAVRSAPAVFQYLLKQPAQDVRLEVLDAQNRVIRTYPDTANAAGGRGGRGRCRRRFGRRRWGRRRRWWAWPRWIRERRPDAHRRDSTRSRGTFGTRRRRRSPA